MKDQAVESVFLVRPFQPADPVRHRVLVLGNDRLGLELANRLSREGFHTLVIGGKDGSQAGECVTLQADSVLEEVHGFAGRFEVVLRSAGQRSRERVGCIVAAEPASIIPKFEDYGLVESERVISLSALESVQLSGEPLPPRRGDWFHALFLVGLQGESEPAEFAKVLDAIERLGSIDRLQSYVFARNLKVAAPGLERRYRELREQGTVFFKFDEEGPELEDSPDGVLITFKDPLLGVEMELAPDLLVVDERLGPPNSLKPLLDAIPSSPAASPFLKPDSTRFAGVETAKAGIFAVGPSRGVFDPQAIAGDIDAVVLGVRKLAQESPLEYLTGPAEIDPAKCTLCLTCVRLCPHGAISFHTSAEADPATCLRCGICAVECPMKAIRLQPPSGEKDTIERARESLLLSNEGAKKIVAFLCSRSAAQALDSAGMLIRERLTPIIVPCAGAIDPSHILSAIEAGADGVLAAGCFKGNCASVYGTVLASERVNQVRQALEEAGLDPGRVVFASLAGNTPSALVRAVQELEANVRRGLQKRS